MCHLKPIKYVNCWHYFEALFVLLLFSFHFLFFLFLQIVKTSRSKIEEVQLLFLFDKGLKLQKKLSKLFEPSLAFTDIQDFAVSFVNIFCQQLLWTLILYQTKITKYTAIAPL